MIKNDFPIRLFQRQKEAWDMLQDDIHTEVLYWWGAWWWKSMLGSLWLATEIASKPWSTWAICRSELKKIKLSTLITFRKILQQVGFNDDSYRYDDQKGIFSFVNWCLVVLVDLFDNPSDPNYDRLWSTEYTGVFIDEWQEIDWKAKDILSSRIRNLFWKDFFYSISQEEASEWIKENWKGVLYYNEVLKEYHVYEWINKPKMLITCNPWHNFIYTDFYKPHKNNSILSYRTFIQSLPKDNPFLPKDYIVSLENLDKVSRERLLYWNFDYDDDPSVLFAIDDINKCFRDKDNKIISSYYLTIDVARLWKDRTVIWVWNWMYLEKIKVIDRDTLTNQADIINSLIKKYYIELENVIVDEWWVGWWLVDIIGCKWFITNASAISPYSAKLLPYMRRNYANLKTQAFFYLKQYIESQKIGIYSDCEYREIITEELLFIRQIDIDNDSKIRLESKKDLKDRLGRSPDFADMISMRLYWIIKKHWEWQMELEEQLEQEWKELSEMDKSVIRFEEWKDKDDNNMDELEIWAF